MKIFNTFQELWAQCLFCPVCQDVCRAITINSDLPGVVIENWSKKEQIVSISVIMTISSLKLKNHKAQYEIDGINNSFTTSFQGKSPELSFQIVSVCEKCLTTFTVSSSCILDVHSGKIYNIGIDKDNAILSDGKHNYSITLLYYSGKMLISKHKIDELVSEHDTSDFPLVKLDFSHPNIALNKIKTMLLFS